jgi:hypothetical protein
MSDDVEFIRAELSDAIVKAFIAAIDSLEGRHEPTQAERLLTDEERKRLGFVRFRLEGGMAR